MSRRYHRPSSPVHGAAESRRIVVPADAFEPAAYYEPYYPPRAPPDARVPPPISISDRAVDSSRMSPRLYPSDRPASQYDAAYPRPRRATLDQNDHYRRPIVTTASRPAVRGDSLPTPGGVLVRTPNSDADEDYYVTPGSRHRRQVSVDVPYADRPRDGRVDRVPARGPDAGHYQRSGGPDPRKYYYYGGPAKAADRAASDQYVYDGYSQPRTAVPVRDDHYLQPVAGRSRAGSLDPDRQRRPLSMVELERQLPQTHPVRVAGAPPPPFPAGHGFDHPPRAVPHAAPPTRAYDTGADVEYNRQDIPRGARKPVLVHQAPEEPRTRHRTDYRPSTDYHSDLERNPREHARIQSAEKIVPAPVGAHDRAYRAHDAGADYVGSEGDRDSDSRRHHRHHRYHRDRPEAYHRHRHGHEGDADTDGSNTASQPTEGAGHQHRRRHHHHHHHHRQDDSERRAGDRSSSEEAPHRKHDGRDPSSRDARDLPQHAEALQNHSTDRAHDAPPDAQAFISEPPRHPEGEAVGAAHHLSAAKAEADSGGKGHAVPPGADVADGKGAMVESAAPKAGENGSEQQQPRVVSPPRSKDVKLPLKGILREPREKFPEDPAPLREGVAPLKDSLKDGRKGIPPGARWTKIDRRRVNPAALRAAHERFEERPDHVIVLRVLTREEIEELAAKTQQIRDARERRARRSRESRRKSDDAGHDARDRETSSTASGAEEDEVSDDDAAYEREGARKPTHE